MILASRNLSRRPLRSALALCGVAIGVAAYVALVSIADGFVVTLTRIGQLGQPDLVVQTRGVVDPILSAIAEPVLAELRADEALAEVDTYATHVARQPAQPFFLVFGLAAGGASWRSCRIEEGRSPLANEREVLLGRLAAERLELGVGGELQASGGALRICGIFSSSNALLAGSAVTTSEQHHALFPDRPLAQLAFLHFAEGVDRRTWRTRFEERHATLQTLEPSSFTDAYPELDLGRQLARAVSWIACLAAAIGVLNTMMMNVLERTREIGTLLAIGWTRSRVLRMILAEGCILALLGGAAGLLLGALGAQLTVAWLDWVLVTAQVRTSTLLEGGALALILGVLGSLVPALRASRLAPTEALRYE
ncbi:MAG: ABC transporter permease [Planctomycetes bacterium]|nr:ABC transporter permease [Planctomycetota bacterium]